MRASSSPKPCSFNCCVSSSRCASISAAKSLCLRFRQNIALTLPDLGSQNPPDGGGQSPPLGHLSDKLFAARRRERVEARLPIVRGGPPLGRAPAALFQALKRGI